MFSLLILQILFTVIDHTKGNLPGDLVTTKQGLVEGYLTKTLNGKSYYAFEGIPYAEPPTGQNRFQDPVPKKPWSGVWKADTLHTCIQYYHSTNTENYPVIGQEDCLYLNVYTPYNRHNANFDVIIFIHGGAFMFNSGATYGPKYILDRDVIYVTLNYRLGPLGFLSTEDNVVPGNAGIKDQILALKWIKNNIQYFNGNPNSITLTGMSAGGASVHLHYMTPLSRGLFHRGIAQSGTMLNSWVLAENSRQKAKKLGAIMGCPNENTLTMIECLKARPALQIMGAVKYFQKWLYNPISPFGVVIDTWSNNPVLLDHPIKLLKNKQFQDIPLIFSHVGAEGLYPGADFIREDSYLENLNENWNDLLPHILEYNNTVRPEKINEISRKIRQEYLKDTKLTKQTYSKLIQLMSDRLFITDIEKAAKIHSSSSNSTTFYYFFSYRGAHSKSELRSGKTTDFGVSHADDTVYILYSNIDMRSNENDLRMSEILIDMWITFAHNGNPKLPNTKWMEISKDPKSNLKYLHIESPEKINMKDSRSLGNSEFWETLDILENDLLFEK